MNNPSASNQRIEKKFDLFAGCSGYVHPALINNKISYVKRAVKEAKVRFKISQTMRGIENVISKGNNFHHIHQVRTEGAGEEIEARKQAGEQKDTAVKRCEEFISPNPSGQNSPLRRTQKIELTKFNLDNRFNLEEGSTYPFISMVDS